MSREPLELGEISARRRAFDAAFLAALDRATAWLEHHWLLALNVLTGLLAGLAFLAPLLMSLGLRLPAQGLYLFYTTMCHQLPQRSFFVFGYQVAQCQRNTAIYGALFLAGLAFAFVRRRLAPLDWRLYGLLSLPMAVDGGTQLFGWQESNWELRTATVVLFGKADCSLCDKAKLILRRLQEDYPLRIEEVDITQDADLMQRYQYLIPVVHVDDHVS